MRNFMVRAIGPFLLTAAAALGAGSVYAQAAAAFQPTKPVKIIVPFGAGGATDILARTVADKLTRSLGQPVIVDNRAGASGLIGISEVARAPADGHTLLVTNTALLQAPLLNSKAGYDPITGFTPVAQLSLSPLVFSVGSRSQAKDLREFIAMAKARPGTMTYGSAGTGQTLHLMGEVLTRSAGIQLNHVPYKGESPFINDLVGGPCGFRLLVHCGGPAAHQGGITARAGGCRHPAVPDAARRADPERAWPGRLRADELVRPVCAGRHATGHRCGAAPRGQIKPAAAGCAQAS